MPASASPSSAATARGKSTLLQILGGDLPPDSGLVLRQPGVRVARLVQDVPLSTDRTVADGGRRRPRRARRAR